MKCSKLIYIDHARTRACALSTELSLQNVGTMSSSAVNRCSAPVQKYARFVSRARVVSESVEQHAVRKTMQEERRRRFAVHQYGSILHVVARVPRLNSTLLHDIGSEPRRRQTAVRASEAAARPAEAWGIARRPATARPLALNPPHARKFASAPSQQMASVCRPRQRRSYCSKQSPGRGCPR